MDPDAALAILTDPTYDVYDRTDAGLALIAWLARGGYIPATLLHVAGRDQLTASPARSLAAIARVCGLIEEAR